MEKLGQLHADAADDGRWDLIVVDTPPSRSALDFLDAPERLSSLLDGRFIKLLLTPAKGPARFLTAGFGMVTAALNKVLGAQILTDVQTFVAAFDTLFGGFRQRAEATYALLQAPETAFVVVASPEQDAIREAMYFVERLTEEQMPLSGLVLNRVTVPQTDAIGEADAIAAAERLDDGDDDHPLVGGLLRVHANRVRAEAHEARLRLRFEGAHPQVPIVSVPALAGDVHDLDGLRVIGDRMAS